MSRRLLLFLASLAFIACSGGKTTDGGTAGGGTSGGGGGTGGTGGTGGSAGGAAADDQCNFGGPRNCMAGFACTLAALGDGGLGKRCVAGACDLIDQDCD